MPTTSSFGTVSLSGTTPRVFGTSSKIDTDTLVQAAYDLKRLPATRLQNRITANDAKLAALSELRGLLTSLKDDLNGLRNPPGFDGRASDIFEAKAAYLTSNTATPPGSIAGVTATSEAAPGRYSLVVERLAATAKLRSAAADPAQTLAAAWNGGAAFAATLGIGLAGGPQASVVLTGTMTLGQAAAAINAQAGTSGVNAQVLNVSATEQRLILTGRDAGKAVTLSDVAGTPTAMLGATTLQAPQTAKFWLDGTPLERDTNRVGDALPGVTLELFNADLATTVQVSVERSLGAIKEKVVAAVDGYNAIRDFVTRQSARDGDGRPADGAVLAGDPMLRRLVRSLGAEVGRAVGGLTAGAPATLRSVGISLAADNRLVIDQAKLDAKLVGNAEDLRGVMGFGFRSASPDLALFRRSNALGDTGFAVAVTDADADGVAEAVSFDGVAGTVDGINLKGASGTAYEGLELLWAGNGSTSIAVEASQGVADRLYNVLDEVLRTVDGTLARQADELATQTDRWRKDIARIEQRATADRDRQIVRYAALETALTRSNALMEQLRAQLDASKNN